LTLVEKAQEEIDITDAAQLQEKILKAQFDFDDFLKNTRMMKNMGSFGGMLKMLPGMKINDAQIQEAEKQLKRCESMIGSMTKQERKDPDLIAKSPSRKQRIANGSGYKLQDVTKLVADFQKMRALMQQMGQGKMPNFPSMPNMGGGFPGMGGNQAPSGNPAYGKKKKKKKGFGEL
ncbi:MAG: signal recognition particle protein, partial [Pseudanabaena sp.]